MAIQFTQYLRPNGEKRDVTIERSEEVEKKAQEIIARGFVFEAEVLMNSVVSLTITDPEEGDLAIELVHQGPGVPPRVDKLVNDFHAKMLKEGLTAKR